MVNHTDFVARAGGIIDRAQRMAGLLLIVALIESAVILVMLNTNSTLATSLERMSKQLPVYVIPGSTRGIYSPTEDDLLIYAFVDTVTQSFNTFTYETLGRQYDEMRPFFTPEMLTFSQGYFEKLLRDSRADRRSQLFIPDRQSMRVEKILDNGVEARAVMTKGSLQTILAGSVVESVPLEISMRLRKTIISKLNPFGFQLAAYNVRRLAPENGGGVGNLPAPNADVMGGGLGQEPGSSVPGGNNSSQ